MKIDELLNTLIVGDFETKMKLIPDESVDIIVTSPPYNLDLKYESCGDNLVYSDYLEFMRRWMKDGYRVAKNDGRMCLDIILDGNVGGHQCYYIDVGHIAKEVGWNYRMTIIWNKTQITGRTAWGSWMSPSAPSVIAPVEMIGIFYKKDWKKNEKGVSDITKQEFVNWTHGVWTFPYSQRKLYDHPSPFPEEIPKRLLKLFSYRHDRVLDPFNGTGTTSLVARRLFRYFIGIDISKKYCETALSRVREVERQTTLSGTEKDYPFTKIIGLK